MTDTTINDIAGRLYASYIYIAAPGTTDDPAPTWAEYAADPVNATAAEAWRNAAKDTPSILAAAGITSVQDTVAAAGKAASNKALSIVYTLLAAALGAVGCGHDVAISPDGATICRAGACLVVDGAAQSITYTQHAPTPDEITPAVTVADGDK